MTDVERVTLEAQQEAQRLMDSGVSPAQAVEWAVDLCVKRHRRGVKPLIGVIEEVKNIVSPWLWVLSVVGFVMAITNTNRITRMYGSWKAGRQAMKSGTPPGE